MQSLEQTLAVQRAAVIRGTKGSGRTTIALQYAINLIRSGRTALYLDLANSLSPDFRDSVLRAFNALHNRTCVIIADNVQESIPLVTEIHSIWNSSMQNRSSRLLLIDLWDPRSSANAHFERLAPLIDIHLTPRDVRRVHGFWVRLYSSRPRPSESYYPVSLHSSPALSLGKLCASIATGCKPESLDPKTFTLYDGQRITIRQKGKHSKPSKVTPISNYVKEHPKEQVYANSLSDLIQYFDKRQSERNNRLRRDRLLLRDRLSQPQGVLARLLNISGIRKPAIDNSAEQDEAIMNAYRNAAKQDEAIVDAYARLSEHPILKWHYQIEPFDQVFEFIKETKTRWPRISVQQRIVPWR
ncbi:MAG: hypothetical protein NT154_22190, partial [Verrucomicrobia bacterium]|nr:hypothetical protein [Verrucomicrobiota bacterium]